MNKLLHCTILAVLLVLILHIAPISANAEVGTMTLPSAMKIIESEAFYGVAALDKVVLPEGTTEIHSLAFVGCSLTEVVLPSTLTYIASDAFDVDSDMNVIVPENSYAYYRCVELGLIEGNAVEETPEECFTYEAIDDTYCRVTGYAGAATDVVIPETLGGYIVKTIGDRAFESYDDLKMVFIPDSVEYIGEYAFAFCDGLTTVKLGSGVRIIEIYAFSECKSLTTINLPDSVEAIGTHAFGYCGVLTHVNYPRNWNKVIAMGAERRSPFCFSGLSSITIPEGVTEIPANAFYDAISLASVSLPTTLMNIGPYGFAGCDALTAIVIPASVEQIGEWSFAFCDKLTTVKLGSGVRTIDIYAFSECKSLTTINLPDSVESIGTHAFGHCWALTHVNYPRNWNKVLAMGAERRSPFCGSGLSSITIPEGVTEIPANAFYDAISLASVSLPTTLMNIGPYGFAGCDALTAIVIPASVEQIGEWSFAFCDKLTTVKLGSGVRTIDIYAFSECKSLTTINLPDSVESIGTHAFGHCWALTHVNYPRNWNKVLAMGADRTSPFYNSGLSSITIPEGVIEIPANAFYAARSLTYVSLPSTLTSIGNYGFAECDALTAIVIPDSVEYIGEATFAFCDKLMTVKLGSGVRTIDIYAFAECKSLTIINLPPAVMWIGHYAFMCTNIELVYGEPGSYAETYANENGIPFSTESMPDPDYGEFNATVTFHVYSPEGIGIADATIQVVNPTTSAVIVRTVTDAQGQAVVEGLQQRPYLFRCYSNMFSFSDITKAISSTDEIISFTAEKPAYDYLTAAMDSYIVDMSGGSVNVAISASMIWTATTETEWLTLTNTSGQPGQSLIVSAETNNGLFRTGEITLATATMTTTVYIQQPGALSSELPRTVITYPAADNAAIPYGDITVTWTPVEGAGSYVVSLRDLDTDELLIHHEAQSERSQAVLSSLYFSDAHSYRVAVGAVPPGAASTDSVVSWCERVFVVDEYINTEPVVFTGVVYELFDASLVSNLQSAARNGMDVELMAQARAQATEGIDFRCSWGSLVELYHLNREENIWEFVMQSHTDEEGRYRFSGDQLTPGEEYSFVFVEDELGFTYISGVIERLTYTAHPGTNNVIDVYGYRSSLAEQIEAFRKLQGYDIAGCDSGLFAEYFAYSDKHKAFLAQNKRNEGRVQNVDFSWSATKSDGKNTYGKIGYSVLNVYKYGENHSKSKPSMTVNYVPFKFSARFSGYIKLLGGSDADTLTSYKFRVRGDDGVRLILSLPSYEYIPPKDDWYSRSFSENVAEIDLSSVAFLNGTVLEVTIEYYNQNSTFGEANLIFEYSTNKGKEWNTVPKEWLYQRKEERVSVMEETAYGGINYASQLAIADDKLANYGDYLIGDLLYDLGAMGIDNAVTSYQKGNILLGKHGVSSKRKEFAWFLVQKIGINVSKAVYATVVKESYNDKTEVEMWARIKEEMENEFDLKFDTWNDATTNTIDGIGTMMSMMQALSQNANGDVYMIALHEEILNNVWRNSIGNRKLATQATNGSTKVYSTLFDLEEEEQQLLRTEVLKLEQSLEAEWKLTAGGIDIINKLISSKDATTNRAALVMMFAETNEIPDLLAASLSLAGDSYDEAFFKLTNQEKGTPYYGELRRYNSKEEFETAINSLSDNTINRLFARLQGVNLDELLYKDLLKLTLDTAYTYYKSTLGIKSISKGETASAPLIVTPTIKQHVNLCEGESEEISIIAADATAYQWYMNRNDGQGYVPISDATNSAYWIIADSVDNNGFTFYCVAKNAYGETKSPEFILSVFRTLEVPETGDDSRLVLWCVLMVLSIVGMIALGRRRQEIYILRSRNPAIREND